MHKKVIFLSFWLLFIFSFSHQSVKGASKKHPNVIYIYASDLGKGLLSAYGQKHFTTPNIDALIHNGVSFNNAYGGARSAQARVSLLTGYHDCHKNKWRIPNGGGYIKEDTAHIQERETFVNEGHVPFPENDLYLPQVFQRAGYITAQIGVLGWGNISTRAQMESLGWDYFYGYLDHERSRGYYPTFLFENNEIAFIEGNTRVDCGKSFEPETNEAYKERWNMEGKKKYAPELFIDKTLEFIHEYKNLPFFIMYCTQLPKGPVSTPEIHPEVAGNEQLTQVEKEYASMVKQLDKDVGALISELRTLGIEENTMIVFASDNGHEIYYTQQGRIERPFRNMITNERFDNSYSKYYSDKAGDIFNGNNGLAGLKRSNLEGGIQIPLTFYWKGKLKKNTSQEVVSNYDFLPTMADLLDVKLGHKKDGVSLLSTLTKGRKLSKKRTVVVSSDEGPALITNEGWKLRYYRNKKKYELYNLKKDPEEKYDIILRFPKKAKELEKILLKECNGKIENGIIY